ncbi:uncharacterized protein PRCAT00006258001 [Priceomyces carsonii]|uniref:uncharacterized protein n=1 Tax=Priceomyces carsonii TaxID=28549 RepID=UPI002ED93071|nr:unnamed protein product [Priceomyces carsonii]
MYQPPVNYRKGEDIGKHVSASSSVYSPIESEFAFKYDRSNDIEEEGDLSDKYSDLSIESYRTIRSSEASEDVSKMEPEPSTQTFQTYVTARGGTRNPSFSSINESLLRGGSDDEWKYHQNSSFGTGQENDVTPKLVLVPNYSAETDVTPKMDGGDFNNDLEVSDIGDNKTKGKSPQLPQHELSSKFKRLSLTLQQSNLAASGESHEFMSSFHQNVDRANSTSQKTATRTSLYYNKIEEVPTENDEREDSKIVDRVRDDLNSEVSTMSNRSSILSEANSGPPLSKSPNRPLSTISSDFAKYEDGQYNATQNNKRGSYNIRGSKLSPQKAVKGPTGTHDEVPIRRDLVYKFEQLSTDVDTSNISEKDKNKFFLESDKEASEGEVANQADGLNIIYNGSSSQASSNKGYTSETTKGRSSSVISSSQAENDLSSLFILALHPFDSSTLQSEADASICLSFDREDIAFIHTIDDSGWGEVTLIESLQRGWIPMNYFSTIVVDNDEDESITDIEISADKIPNSSYLGPLFHACGKFLIDPLSHKNRHGKYTFSIRVINSIRDGVRLLLQETDCLSRSNEIVTKRPIVRKSRKSLLADWYKLMVKANEFKGTSNFDKIEFLTLMVYQVTRKAIDFLKVWSIESRQIVQSESEKKLHNDMMTYPLLSAPPMAKQRVTEINGILYSYLGLIIGRLDLIEHNAAGCDILETLTHQIILLLRELLFISKMGSDFSAEKPADLDGALDTLLSLVSDLVTGVKSLVIKTVSETDDDRRYHINKATAGVKDYYYTQEGGDLIQIASKMISSISVTVNAIRKLLDVTSDFKLNAKRSYPDYSKIKIEADEFIKKCSIGIAKSQTIKNQDLRQLRSKGISYTNRYSMMRTGKTGELSLTPGGADLLRDALDIDSTPFSVSNAEFEPFTNTKDGALQDNINNELLVDKNGNLLGASFKGLVYTLTNEDSPPEYFFVSTFFICFRSFANGIDLIEQFITRFDIDNKSLKTVSKEDVSSGMRLKNRRRLIVKMFQLWMESYWNPELDYSLLTTLINFFNEGIAVHLPLDSMKLIEVAAKLSLKPLIEHQKPLTKQKNRKQLINRSITITRANRRRNSSVNSLSSRYSMVDGYELSKINTNSSTSSSLKSMTLPLPLGVGNQTSSSNSLLTKNQLITIEKVNLTYRSILGTNWCPRQYLDTRSFVPLDLSKILPNWYSVCDQNWVLSNYRPNLLDFNGLEIAKQLTLIESHMFCAIKPDELLNENFTAKRAYLKLAPNVRQSLLFTNCLSGYVLESVLQPDISPKMRINMMKNWLKIAISCLYLRNFNSLAAIITALQSHLVTRLTRIWAELSDKYRELYEYLSGIVHPDKNYSVYRNKLRNFLVNNDYNIPIVPYFSLFLQDLTFVTEGNPNYRKANTFLNQKLINIDKYLKITRIIADIESLQLPYLSTLPQKENKRSSMLFPSSSKLSDVEDYNIISVESMQELILFELWKVCELNKSDEDRAWKLSCAIHPREAN